LFKTHVTDRLQRLARRALGRVQQIQPTRQAASLGRQNRLVQQVLLELDAVMQSGDLARLEYLLGLLHLSYVFLDETTGQKLHKKLQPVLKRIYQQGQNDLEARTESTAPLAYFVSYPRSGNTLATRLTAKATQGQVLSAMAEGFAPFSKRIYPKSYSLPRLVKDHVAHPHYQNDRCVLVARDGRDTVISLAFMTLQQGEHGFAGKGEVADFIRWVSASYVFGDWAAHVRNLLDLARGPNKLLVRYDDLVAKDETFIEIVDFFDPGNKLPRAHLSKLFAERNAVVEGIKSAPAVNDQWGFGRTFEPGSMFHEWSLNRQGSSWRETWDGAAKRAFHETGATELLIELGFETDPDWWRQ
jgi:Sulfotransferase domain